ncbi:MAG: CDP-alcohol phosphatidyltransferase family protein [Candidatus Omnitrophica bacterium]|nr:CDP-alcohol phosphatidyltransferase family protein [Candidatus Omnitrophota bacterium]
MLNLANKLSILRILLIPVFVATIMYYTPQNDFLRLWAVGVFLLAIFSDALDGYIARVKGERTPLGTFLDPLADKLLLITVFICLSAVKTLPPEFKLAPWVVIIVISRDAIIVLGSTIIHMVNGKLKISPTILGKLTTFLQMMTVLTLLLQFKFFPVIMYVMVFFTVLSGLDYIRIGSRSFNESSLH